MKHSFIDKLQCPCTGSPLELTGRHLTTEDEVRFGILSGDGDDYPIVDGIAWLRHDELRGAIVSAVRRERYNEAVRIACDWPDSSISSSVLSEVIRVAYKGAGVPIAAILTHVKRPLYRSLTSHNRSFCALVDRIGTRCWADWQKYRFSMATFAPLYSLLPLMDTDGYILDLAAGTGHASYLLSHRGAVTKLVCADRSFSSLHLARRYFVPQANFVCLDANARLPFLPEMFSRAVCSDAIHFIAGKQLLANELLRTLNAAGRLMVVHAHNRYSAIASGMALTPAAYRGLFKGYGVLMFPDDYLINAYLGDGELDFDASWSDCDLNAAHGGLSMVVSRDGIEPAHAPSSAIGDRSQEWTINPMYQIRKSNGRWLLKKRVSRSYRKSVEARIRNYAVEEMSLSQSEFASCVAGNLARIEPERFLMLVRAFILIQAPHCYAEALIPTPDSDASAGSILTAPMMRD